MINIQRIINKNFILNMSICVTLANKNITRITANTLNNNMLVISKKKINCIYDRLSFTDQS